MDHELHLFQVCEGESIQEVATRVLEPLRQGLAPAPITASERRRRAYIVMNVRLAAPELSERDLEVEAATMGIQDGAPLCRLQRVELSDTRPDGTGVRVEVHPRHVSIFVPEAALGGSAGSAIDAARRICDILARRAELHLFNPVTGRRGAISDAPGELLIDYDFTASTGSDRADAPDRVVESAPPHPSPGESPMERSYASAGFIPRGRSLRQRQYGERTRWRPGVGGIIALVSLPAIAVIFQFLPAERTDGFPSIWNFVGLVTFAVLAFVALVACVVMWRQDKRRRGWRRRGCCLECGYSRRCLDEASDCPECGAPSPYI